MASIELENVCLTYRVRTGGGVSIMDWLLRRKSLPKASVVEIRALQDVSFQVREGERLGIIGSNGAGKTSLLRVLAGVYPSTAGERRIEGCISSLFDLALGFEPEANGWENIAYRAYLQGETPQSVRTKLAAIAEFSELGHFMDVPLRYYSAGMKVRLAFSIATAVEPEILLVDEVLAVGDAGFRVKARRRMREMMAAARLIVVVSHDLESLPDLCERGLWLHQGRIQQDGPIDAVIAAYQNWTENRRQQAA